MLRWFVSTGKVDSDIPVTFFGIRLSRAFHVRIPSCTVYCRLMYLGWGNMSMNKKATKPAKSSRQITVKIARGLKANDGSKGN